MADAQARRRTDCIPAFPDKSLTLRVRLHTIFESQPEEEFFVEFFFNPDGVAVIGATDGLFKGGYHILNNMLGGYRGRIYPVNPRFETLLSVSIWPYTSYRPGFSPQSSSNAPGRG
jgi:hypothetical protein